MAAELGESTDPRELVPGEPEQIANDLRALVTNIRTISGIGDALDEIDPAGWTGDAADAFREAFGREPRKWTDLGELLAQGGKSLADYGDVLTWAQSEAQRAIDMHTAAQAASRAAFVQWVERMSGASFAERLDTPFEDPGKDLVQEAQDVLDNARTRLASVGDTVAGQFGVEQDEDGGFKYSKDYEFGTDHRKPEWRRDDRTGEWVEEEDPNGWQGGRFGRSYHAEVGVNGESDGMLSDTLGDTAKALGIDLDESTHEASASVAVFDGSAGGESESGSWHMEGSALGASASAGATTSSIAVSGEANADAYLAKESVEGEYKLGDHAAISGSAKDIAGAEVGVDGTAGVTGVQAGAKAFAGAKIEAEAGAEVAGVNAGVHGSVRAGIGAEASGQIGLGDDGKFHVSASLGAAVGIGGSVGFDFSIDPQGVVDTVKDVADDVGDFASGVATDVGHGIENAADAVGDLFGL